MLYIHKCQRLLLKMDVEHIRNVKSWSKWTSSICLCLIFDQTTMTQEQKYLRHISDWSCMTFEKHARQAKCPLRSVMVTGPSARGRGSKTRTHWLHVTGKPEIHNYYSFLIRIIIRCFAVIKWFLWSSIPPSIPKHHASRPWKTAYHGP